VKERHSNLPKAANPRRWPGKLSFLGILNDSDIGWLVTAGSRREIAAGSRLTN
jgi:hypothetical protein